MKIAPRCPICGNIIRDEKGRSMPFCSERCRRIDLGRWLREDYRVPVVRQEDPDEEASFDDHLEYEAGED